MRATVYKKAHRDLAPYSSSKCCDPVIVSSQDAFMIIIAPRYVPRLGSKTLPVEYVLKLLGRPKREYPLLPKRVPRSEQAVRRSMTAKRYHSVQCLSACREMTMYSNVDRDEHVARSDHHALLNKSWQPQAPSSYPQTSATGRSTIDPVSTKRRPTRSRSCCRRTMTITTSSQMIVISDSTII